jgi:hypothetical protein
MVNLVTQMLVVGASAALTYGTLRLCDWIVRARRGDPRSRRR